jgi:hypothetical protein
MSTLSYCSLKNPTFRGWHLKWVDSMRATPGSNVWLEWQWNW